MDEQSLQDLIANLEAQKAKRPELRAKLQALIDYNKRKIQALRNSYAQKFFGDDVPPYASTIKTATPSPELGLNGGNSVNNQHPLSKYLSQQKAQLNSKLRQLQVEMEKEASQLKNMSATANAGLLPNSGPKTMQANFMQVAAKLRPGNLGDINRVVWPFWFTTTKVTLPPNTTGQGNVTITQEAAFIWLGYTKIVYLEQVGNPGAYNYIDPEQPDAAGKANNLTMSIRDSQSSRTFMNKSIDLNQIGTWKYPTILPTPQLLLPNSNMEFGFSNSDQNNTYRPFVCMYGLRVRIEDAKNILSTISA